MITIKRTLLLLVTVTYATLHTVEHDDLIKQYTGNQMSLDSFLNHVEQQQLDTGTMPGPNGSQLTLSQQVLFIKKYSSQYYQALKNDLRVENIARNTERYDPKKVLYFIKQRVLTYVVETSKYLQSINTTPLMNFGQMQTNAPVFHLFNNSSMTLQYGSQHEATATIKPHQHITLPKAHRTLAIRNVSNSIPGAWFPLLAYVNALTAINTAIVIKDSTRANPLGWNIEVIAPERITR